MGTRSARAHKVTWGRMGRGRTPAGLGVTSTWNWLFWRGEGGQRGKSEFGCLPPLPPVPRCRAKSSQSPMTHLMVLLYQLCVSGTRVWAASHPLVRAGEAQTSHSKTWWVPFSGTDRVLELGGPDLGPVGLWSVPPEVHVVGWFTSLCLTVPTLKNSQGSSESFSS